MKSASVLVLGIVWFGLAAPAHSDTIPTSAGPVEITPIQHASLTLQAGNKLIYVDPSPAALFENKSKADLIIITDIHADHMDLNAIKEISGTSTKIIAPAAVQKTVTNADILNNGQKTSWN